MQYILSNISTGVGTGLSVLGVGGGIVTTTLAAIYGVPATVIGVSVAAPVACAYDVFLGKGALMAAATKEQLETLKAANDEREAQLKKADAQLQKADAQIETSEEQIRRLTKEMETLERHNRLLEDEVSELNEITTALNSESEERQEQLAKSEKQIAEQEAQIKKLWEIHGNLRLALQGLAVAGDTFDQFGGILTQHAATLSERIDQISETTTNLDQTAAVLADLTHSLENHIETDRGLRQTRALLFE
jgi:predicted  nucleic acid-binding Zn-ribbon protein